MVREYGMCVAEKTVAPPETIDTTASRSSLVDRSMSGICEENIKLSSWVLSVTDIFYLILFVAKVVFGVSTAKDNAGRSPSRGIARRRFRGGHPFGRPPIGKLSDLIIHVLANLLKGGGQLLGLILGQSPTAAVLGVRVLVAEDCPPCHGLAVLMDERIAVNAHAMASCHLVIVHGILRLTDAANGLLQFPFHRFVGIVVGGSHARPPVKHSAFLFSLVFVLRLRLFFSASGFMSASASHIATLLPALTRRGKYESSAWAGKAA